LYYEYKECLADDIELLNRIRDIWERYPYEHLDEEGTKHRYRFINEVPLNDANFDLNVNFMKYWQEKKEGNVLHFSWVTDINLSIDNVYKVMRAGRSRWRSACPC